VRQLTNHEELTLALMAVAVNAGIMSAAIEPHWNEEIRANWHNKLASIKQYCDQQVGEIHLFAEALDEEEK
jgi:hypothetical protein